MSSRTAKFASVICASILASIFTIILPYRAANAADDCLPEPKGVAPQGQHWFYRMDRSTQQRCWYLRDVDARASTADMPAAAPAKTAVRKPEAVTPDAISDARAELPARARRDTDTTSAGPEVAPTAADVADPVFPAPSGVISSVTPQPDASAPSTDSAAQADNQTAAQPPDPAPAAMLATPAAPAEPVKPTGSIQMLFLVAGGALALAGLTGSGVYRLAGARRRGKDSWRSTWQKAAKKQRRQWAEMKRERAARRADVAPARTQPHVARQHVQERTPERVERHADVQVLQARVPQEPRARAPVPKEPARAPAPVLPEPVRAYAPAPVLPEPARAYAPVAQEPVRFQPRAPQEQPHVRTRVPQEKVEEIEAFLARFSKQMYG